MLKLISLYASFLLLLGGCTNGSREFTLPEGNVERGKTAFTEMGCASCHSIDGIVQGNTPKMSIQLGGKVTTIKTYGELVTSVINPSHRISEDHKAYTTADGKSKMKYYNDVMTVSELTDIVYFLQSKYELKPIELTRYRTY